MADHSGQYFGRYYLIERPGEGGMAVVYKAYDTRLERDVAVKAIRSGAFPSDDSGGNFEAKTDSICVVISGNSV